MTLLPLLSNSTGHLAGQAGLAKLSSLNKHAVDHAVRTIGMYVVQICVQERHDVLGKERQSQFDRASAAEVARAAVEVQLTAQQERGAHLTTQLQESGVQIQVTVGFSSGTLQ